MCCRQNIKFLLLLYLQVYVIQTSPSKVMNHMLITATMLLNRGFFHTCPQGGAKPPLMTPTQAFLTEPMDTFFYCNQIPLKDHNPQ